MRLIPLAALASLALLAACQPPVEPPLPPATTILGGVDLSQPVRVRGNEPFWIVDITPATLSYYGPDRPQQDAPNPGPVVAGATATFTVTTVQNNALVVTLIDTDCSDGMSELVYPLTASVVISGETLNGCADSLANLTPPADPLNESSPVGDPSD